MEINSQNLDTITQISNPRSGSERSGQSFAHLLDADRIKAANKTARNEILVGQKSQKEDTNKDDIEFIRENGFSAYAEQVQEKKREEMREKILQAMGLSEEMLAEMSPEQRQQVEQLIENEIQKRLAAAAIINGGQDQGEGKKHQTQTADMAPGNLLAAQILTGGTGALAGLLTIGEDLDQPLLNEPGEKRVTG